ncbi:hypothetical protein A5634_10455 [Mycobacterium asiaticum]|uniref:DUF222 domain-containing protein n=1 Tax=Mycobacterium asiaticum TaxID=1790 RepID=A0A1A3NIY1_MYCAS|nr:hypothetical protein A5634_10455 [Mycobacterium asiaticum]
MGSSTYAQIAAALGELDVCADRLCELTFDAPAAAELLGIMKSLQRVVRKLRVPGHAVINQLGSVASPAELGGALDQALADRLRHQIRGQALDRRGRRFRSASRADGCTVGAGIACSRGCGAAR